MSGEARKKIKRIKVDVDKCTGCRACEMACSAFHAVPRYSSINPARARIRVVMDELRDVYVPIRAGAYTPAECSGRNLYTIDGKEYNQCNFCPACCPSRELFKEPDSGLPLKCDMCENDPPLSEPMCVQACVFGALAYEEGEDDDVRAEAKQEELEAVYECLVNKYGVKKVMSTFTRLSKG